MALDLMSKRLAAAVVLFGLHGCAVAPYGWKLEKAGCFERTLHEPLYVPEAAELGPTDIRVGRWVSASDIRILQFSRGLDKQGAEPNREQLVVAAGNEESSCVEVLRMESCPGAEAAYSDLLRLSLPVGFRSDAPNSTEVADGTIYFLASRDRERNSLSWVSAGPVHPASMELENSFVRLEGCFKVVRNRLGRVRSN